MARRTYSIVIFLLLSVFSFGQSPCTAPLYSNSGTLYNAICGGIYYNQYNKIVNGDSIKKYLIAVHKYDSAHGGGSGVDTATYPSAGAASNYTLGVQLHDTALTLGRLKDSNQKVSFTTPYYVKTQINDTANTLIRTKDTNTKTGAATIYYVATHGGTNYLADTSGGVGGKPTLLTLNSGWKNGGNKNGASLVGGTVDNNSVILNVNNSNAFELNASTNAFNAGISSMASGSSAVAVGYNAQASSLQSVAVGGDALVASSTGQGIAVGWFSAVSGSNGNPIAVGYNCRLSGSYAVAVGPNIGASGSFLSAYGSYCLANASGAGNTGIGDSAAIGLTTGAHNTFLGYKTNVSSNSLTNSTAIGFGAIDSASNEIKLGNQSIATVRLGSGTFCLPIQVSTATSGTVVCNGNEVLRLDGAATSLTITMPTPVNGMILYISTSQTSITLSFSSGANFDVTPTAVKNSIPIHLIYDANTGTWGNL